MKTGCLSIQLNISLPGNFNKKIFTDRIDVSCYLFICLYVFFVRRASIVRLRCQYPMNLNSLRHYIPDLNSEPRALSQPRYQ